MEHLEHIKQIKKLVGDFLGEIADAKRIDGSNVAVVKEAVSAYEKLCRLCEDGENEEQYGASGNRGNRGMYGARRRDSRGRYMQGGMMPGYGWMPMPEYGDGDLAEELEAMAQSGGSEAKKTALMEAARMIRQG